MKTLRLLLIEPGRLTVEYLDGRRQPYTPPFRLYLIVSAVAIALMSATGLISLESTLAGSSPEQIEELERLLGMESLDDPLVQDKFDRRFNTLFPILNLITPLGLCLALKAVDWKRLLHAHAIFALHLSSAQVLVSIFLIPAARYSQTAVMVLSVLLVVGLTAYFIVALRKVYGGTWLGTAVRFVVLGAAYAAIVSGINVLALALIIPTL